jgi:putative NADH-flavin reductase
MSGARAAMGMAGRGSSAFRGIHRSRGAQTRGAVVKIFLLGATGNSGRRILRLALQRAHEVTAFVRDETKLLSLVDTPIPPNLRVSIGDISKSANIARVMVGHDVAINAAGQVTEGSTFTQLVQTVVDSAIASLGEGGRLWLFGGAAVLDVPGTHIMGVDLPRSRRFTRHTVATSTHFGKAHWTGQCCAPAR